MAPPFLIVTATKRQELLHQGFGAFAGSENFLEMGLQWMGRGPIARDE
jgi:hypothetical protein